MRLGVFADDPPLQRVTDGGDEPVLEEADERAPLRQREAAGVVREERESRLLCIVTVGEVIVEVVEDVVSLLDEVVEVVAVVEVSHG